MPLFDYSCTKCNASFELLIRSNEKPACPNCGTLKIERLLGAFATYSKGKANIPTCHSLDKGCDFGKCGSGMCSRG